ncbi:antitoxin Xre/MbcA/ParS toxin-binding domain-containing protein [Sphingomonas sp. HMP9]|uniref:antitoxin Xre/MbcA/ParS toxin-binding domain-containing protein n=1 Tax=Sphingomonas sp. HMP9 TaxID=1517554 RepID=UPI001596EB41|nr:antitoxin Xre/MbcA/ParS toxin-binding domain-containing protein [Sphingomonas sp. HMP9]
MADENAIEMRAMISRWDATRQRWGLEDCEEAGLLGHDALVSPMTGLANWGAPKMEQRMRLLIDLAAALDALLVDETRVREWLHRPRRSVGSHTPIEAMSTSVEWIRAFRNAAREFVA